MLGLFVWLAQRLSGLPHEILSVAAEGLGIAAWVLLRNPLEAPVLNRKSTVRVERIDSDGE